MMLTRENISLKQYSFYKTGGNARYFVDLKKKEDLALFFKELRDLEPIKKTVIGACSNILLSDKGIDGLVVRQNIAQITNNANKFEVWSGAMLPVLALKSIKAGYAGFEKIGNIPGSVGGAVFGNAEAYGQSISDRILNVEWCSFEGECKVFNKKDCKFGYRTSIFKSNLNGKGIISRINFELEKGNKDTLIKMFQDDQTKRRSVYPSEPSCGCFFKNIYLENIVYDKIVKAFGSEVMGDRKIGDYFSSGKLIDLVGLKGICVGDACVSEKHANFIINKGKAKSQDIFDLFVKIKNEIRKKIDIDIENEVQIIGVFD